MTKAAPGWYPDPWKKHSWRYFDGTAWTAQVSGTVTQRKAQRASLVPWAFLGGAVLLVVIVVVALAAGGGDGSGASGTQAQDAPLESPSAAPENQTTPGNRFYLRMDSNAISLDKAVGMALDNDPNARERIGRLRSKIRERVNGWLLKGNESVGGNLLLSAATQAREAAGAEDLSSLADARREIAEARSKLAEEALR